MAWQRKMIVAVVEGHGEVKGVPTLLRRWFAHNELHRFCTPAEAVRAAGCGALKTAHDSDNDLGIEYYIAIAARANPDGILVVIDADKECIERERSGRKALGPELLERARTVASHIPISVVVANREYEAWFLAQLEELKDAGVVDESMTLGDGYDAEAAAGYKTKMRQMLGRHYEETIDLEKLTKHLGFSANARKRSPSFDKLVRELEYLTGTAES